MDVDVTEQRVRVVARFRPFNQREIELGVENSSHVQLSESTVSVALPDGKSYNCGLTRCFDMNSTQDEVFDCIASQSMKDLFEGFNCSLFAYGQTGSGKTWTMFGAQHDTLKRGVIPRCTTTLFETIRNYPHKAEFTISCSFLEIYQEKITDLLNMSKRDLQIREHKQHGVFVENLSHEYIRSEADVYQLLELGARHKKTCATKMNPNSSRSHCCFTFTLQIKDEAGCTIEARLNLIDLAGSERISKTQATGVALEEAKKINLSLTSLAQCINALAENAKQHIPYRNSKLTRLLQDSLGGNSKTSMIVTLSPHLDNIDETVSSLRFAERCSSVKTIAKKNLRLTAEELEHIVARLRSELARVKATDPRKGPPTVAEVGMQTEATTDSLDMVLESRKSELQALEEKQAELENDRHNLQAELERAKHETGEMKQTSMQLLEGKPITSPRHNRILEESPANTDSVLMKITDPPTEFLQKLKSASQQWYPAEMIVEEEESVDTSRSVLPTPHNVGEQALTTRRQRDQDVKKAKAERKLRQKARKKELKSKLVKLASELQDLAQESQVMELKCDDQNDIIVRQQEVVADLEVKLNLSEARLIDLEASKGSEQIQMAELEAELASLLQEDKQNHANANIRQVMQNDSVLQRNGSSEDKGVMSDLRNIFSFGF